MQWLALLVVACGCDKLLGLHGTVLADAPPMPYYDARPDAAWMCPSSGAPMFNTASSVIVGGYRGYTIASTANQAMAQGTNSGVGFGAIAGPLQMVIVTPPPMLFASTPQIYPEGNRAFMTDVDVNGAFVRFGIYDRAPDGSWSETGAIPINTGTVVPSIGPPTRGPGERRTVVALTVSNLEEYSDGGTGNWTRYASNVLGTTRVVRAMLTEDGLHLIGADPGGNLVFTARSMLTQPFGAIAAIAMPTGANAPYLTSDCGKLYFDNGGEIASVHQ